MARIVLNPFGSFGDLHPFLALALALKARGHYPLMATSAFYREKIEAAGIAFAAVRPDIATFRENPELAKKLWHPREGTRYLLRDFLLPLVRQAFDDLQPLCEDTDLLLTHAAAYAGPVAADFLKMRWLSVALQPAAFFSSRDMMVLPQAPRLRHVYGIPGLTRLLLSFGDRQTGAWAEPVHALRRELGLPPGGNPVMRGQFSPYGTLALFSQHFAPPAPDWPATVHQTGFLFYDRAGTGPSESTIERRLTEKLHEFLQAGEPPVLFTLGSSAVLNAGDFFEQSRLAAQELGIRAVMLVGPQAQPVPPAKDLFVAPYLRYSEVMPHAAVIVHQGGIGTLAQTLRAGKPALVVPWSHDQPDNAERLARLGVARVLARSNYSARTAARSLRRLLNDQSARERAALLGASLAKELPLDAACQAIESTLR